VITRVVSSLSDAVLVESSLRTPHLFGVLYDRYAADVYRYAFRRVGSAAADDVVAQTFHLCEAYRKPI
jgi:RNA polymerase sigma-70 factor (ECF subfamily)